MSNRIKFIENCDQAHEHDGRTKPKDASFEAVKVTKDRWPYCGPRTAVVTKDAEIYSGNTCTNFVSSYSPKKCPITNCDDSVSPGILLRHLLNSHDTLQLREVYAGKGGVVVFDPNMMKMGQVCCLGILAYAGLADDPDSLPALRIINGENYALKPPYDSFRKHVVIMMMACRTTLAAMVADKKLETELTQAHNPNTELVVLWVTCEKIARPLHATITAFNRTMTASSSTIVKVRPLHESQDPSEFLRDDLRCLQLNKTNFPIDKPIHVEVLINEYDE